MLGAGEEVTGMAEGVGVAEPPEQAVASSSTLTGIRTANRTCFGIAGIVERNRWLRPNLRTRRPYALSTDSSHPPSDTSGR